MDYYSKKDLYFQEVAKKSNHKKFRLLNYGEEVFSQSIESYIRLGMMFHLRFNL